MPPSFAVTGGRPLKGTIRPAGNKNAALPILAATLVADGLCRIDNVPHIGDVETMLELLAHLGAAVQWTGPNSVEVDAARAEPRELDPALCARIRASILLAGPMLARFGRVHLPPPGGDVIGRRRVDTHFLALERLGAEVTVGATYQLEAKKLAGADIFLDEPSVTATENALMAAVAAPAPRSSATLPASRTSRTWRAFCRAWARASTARAPTRSRWTAAPRSRGGPRRSPLAPTTSRSARSSGSPPLRTAPSPSMACAARTCAPRCSRSSGWACGPGSTVRGSSSMPTRSAASAPTWAATFPSSRTARGRPSRPT